MAKLAKLVTIFCSVNLIYLFKNTTASALHCNQNYTTTDGKICKYCPPGTHRSGDCERSGESAICKACDKDHYQSNCTIASSCARCSQECKWHFTIKVKACTLHDDIQCRCSDGRYWHRETDHDGVCLEHSLCSVGEGSVALGHHQKNTKCEPCIDGETFSSEESFERCQRCTECNVYNAPCTAVSDAECATQGTTETSPEARENSSHTQSGKTGLIVGVTLGVPLAISMIVCGVVFLRKKRHRFCGEDSTEEGENNARTQATDRDDNVNGETSPDATDSGNRGAIHTPDSVGGITLRDQHGRSVARTTEARALVHANPCHGHNSCTNGEIDTAIENVDLIFSVRFCQTIIAFDCKDHLLDKDEQICGDDGITYDNHCLFTQARCRSEHNLHGNHPVTLMIRNHGQCVTTVMTSQGTANSHTPTAHGQTTQSPMLYSTGSGLRTESTYGGLKTESTYGGLVTQSTYGGLKTESTYSGLKTESTLGALFTQTTRDTTMQSGGTVTNPPQTVTLTVDPAHGIAFDVFCKNMDKIVCSGFDIICASDGSFYPNECELRKEKCKTPTLTIVSDIGSCSK